MSAIRKFLHDAVDEMYCTRKGVFIQRSEERIEFGDACLSRKQTKHIIERRKNEGKSAIEIKDILDHVPRAVIDPDFEVPNTNPKYPGSVIRAKVFEGWERGVLVVLDKSSGGKRDIITAYLCNPKNAYLLKKKRLGTSAAGETPHS